MNYSSGQDRTVSGLFNDRESAERAYSSISSRGYSRDDVNLLMSDETRKRHFGESTADTELGSKALEGAGVGAATGGTLGAIIGGIAAIGTNVLLPGLGLVVAGPIAAALAGAGAGGLTGGLVGALVGSGIPEEYAAEYESGIKNGYVYMSVNARNDEDAQYFHNEFSNSGGSYVVGIGLGETSEGTTGAAIGSVVPGVGSATGGLLGSIAGSTGGAVAGHGMGDVVAAHRSPGQSGIDNPIDDKDNQLPVDDEDNQLLGSR